MCSLCLDTSRNNVKERENMENRNVKKKKTHHPYHGSGHACLSMCLSIELKQLTD